MRLGQKVTVTFADESASPDTGESVGQQSPVVDEEPTGTPAPTETPAH